MRWLILALAASVAAAPAAAQDMTALEQAFGEADANDDGVVNVDEFVGYIVQVFAAFDENRDGRLAYGDVPNPDRARFDRSDRDGDGMVSVGEAVAERMILFFEVDSSRDGMISMDELMAYERAQPR